ncbi:hypothetical protein [Oricola cellulosilytica]|uniref:hypothetical protein n=1 Tax=Oricola cellulosilytica TaxID=1429082 RepID=UPI001304D3D8|nr:hypothetical protein [Oricola cellulosilytica]
MSEGKNLSRLRRPEVTAFNIGDPGQPCAPAAAGSSATDRRPVNGIFPDAISRRMGWAA